MDVIALASVPRVQAPPEPSASQLRDSTGPWDTWWSTVHGVADVRGEVLVDPATGCLVSGNVDLDLRFLAPSARGAGLRIPHEFALDALSTEPQVQPPPGARLPRRDRVVQMLREVLPKPTP